MTPHQQKLKSLVDKLIKGTAEGSVRWEIANVDSATANLKSATLWISPSEDLSGQDAVCVSIYDDRGNFKMSFDDTVLDHEDWTGERVSYYGVMKSLWASAMRQARGEDEILDSIISELDGGLPF